LRCLGLRGVLRAMAILGWRFTPHERTVLWQVLGSQGLRARERSCIMSPHSTARSGLRMSVLPGLLSILCGPKRRAPPRPGFHRAAHRTRQPSQSRSRQASRFPVNVMRAPQRGIQLRHPTLARQPSLVNGLCFLRCPR